MLQIIIHRSIFRLIRSVKLILVVLTIVLLPHNPLFSKIRILAPTASDTLLAGRSFRIEWEGAQGMPADLFYTTNNGNTWDNIASGITNSYYDWNIPVLTPCRLQVKVVSDLFIKPVLLWEIKEAHNGFINNAVISPDSKYLLTSGLDSKVKVWDMQTRKAIDSVEFGGKTVSKAYFFNNTDSVLIAEDKIIALWDRKSKTITTYGMDEFTDITKDCAIHPSGKYFIAASNDGTAGLFDINNTGSFMKIVPPGMEDPNSTGIYSVRFTKDGKYIILAGYNEGNKGKIYVFDFNTGALIDTCTGHGENGNRTPVWSVDVSPSGDNIISGGVDWTVRVWDRNTFTEKFKFESHKFIVFSVRYHPSGNIIMSGSQDSTVRQWDPNTGTEYNAVINHGGPVLSAEYSPGGDSIVSAGRDRAVRLWKNFEYKPDFDTALTTLRYPASIRIPHITADMGDVINIPLILEKPDTIPDILDINEEGTARIEIPSKLIEVATPVIHSTERYPKDIISTDAKSISFGDTIIFLKSLVLYADIYHDDIRIFDFHLENDSIYHFERIHGSITVKNYCDESQIVKSVYGGNSTRIAVNPNPAAEYAELDLSLAEDNGCSIEIMDCSGNILACISLPDLNHGKHKIELNLKDIPSGTYFLNLKTESEYCTEKLVIIK